MNKNRRLVSRDVPVSEGPTVLPIGELVHPCQAPRPYVDPISSLQLDLLTKYRGFVYGSLSINGQVPQERHCSYLKEIENISKKFSVTELKRKSCERLRDKACFLKISLKKKVIIEDKKRFGVQVFN